MEKLAGRVQDVDQLGAGKPSANDNDERSCPVPGVSILSGHGGGEREPAQLAGDIPTGTLV